MKEHLCSALCLVDWVVLVELVDSIDTEERHVSTNGESEVISMILLLEDNFVTKCFTEPCDIRWSRKTIKVAGEKHGRDVVVLNGH